MGTDFWPPLYYLKTFKIINNISPKLQVHDLMDDIAEQQELANEISSAISSPMGFGMEMDEDELMAELEGMEQEDMDRQVRISFFRAHVSFEMPSIHIFSFSKLDFAKLL